jgi:hypothetical protein
MNGRNAQRAGIHVVEPLVKLMPRFPNASVGEELRAQDRNARGDPRDIDAVT